MNPLHSRDVHGLDGPDLTTLARGQSRVSGTSSSRNGVSEGSVSRLERDGGVDVLLGSDSSSAVTIAFGSGSVSNDCKLI